MCGRTFFDTSILLYSLGAKDPRGCRAEQLLLEGGVVSVQVLNEFSDVAHRKNRMSWSDVRQALQEIQFFCPDPSPITMDTLRFGNRGEARHSDLRCADSGLRVGD